MTFPEPWMERGLCSRLAPQLSWVKDPGQVTSLELADMRAACRFCEVRSQCHDFAVREDISSGFWAGEFRDPPADAMGGAA